MKHMGSISLICSVVILAVFFCSPHGLYDHGIALLTKIVLFASLAISLMAIVLNAARRVGVVAFIVSLAGLGAVGSIADHL